MSEPAMDLESVAGPSNPQTPPGVISPTPYIVRTGQGLVVVEGRRVDDEGRKRYRNRARGGNSNRTGSMGNS